MVTNGNTVGVKSVKWARLGLAEISRRKSDFVFNFSVSAVDNLRSVVG